jgi:hypothetical protein
MDVIVKTILIAVDVSFQTYVMHLQKVELLELHLFLKVVNSGLIVIATIERRTRRSQEKFMITNSSESLWAVVGLSGGWRRRSGKKKWL